MLSGLTGPFRFSFAVELQKEGAVQGNLDPMRVVAGGPAMEDGIDAILQALGNGPLIFNLGHGITPQADPEKRDAAGRSSARKTMSGTEQQTGRSAGRKAAIRAATAIVFFCAIAFAIAIFGIDEALSLDQGPAYHRCDFVDGGPALYAAPVHLSRRQRTRFRQQAETFAVMERRLLKVIMNPAMMVAWVLGLYLAWSVYGFHGGWLHMKLLAVVALTGVHVFFSRAVASFAKGHYVRNARFWRLMNEVPTLLMVLIVILVVVKPF